MPQERGPNINELTREASAESTDTQISSLISESRSGDSGLTPLKGFKIDLSANPGFRKFFYSAKCECGTAALLSVEVAREKTLSEVRKAAPELTRRLEAQASSFRRMSCEAHQRMRLGPAGAPPGRPG